MRCKLCGASSDLAFSRDGYGLHQCSSCGFLFVHPLPDVATIEAYYSALYYDDKDRYDNAGVATTRRWARRLETIEKHLTVDGSKTLLDVGCATGIFLEIAAHRGWNVYGVESSRFAAQQAAQRLGSNRIVCSDFLSYEPSTLFVALSAWAVLEHVSEPLTFLQKAYDLLEYNGIFALSTVNTGSLNRWLFGSKWRYFTPPEHLAYFNLENLVWALGKSGFKLLEIRTNFSYQSTLDGLWGGNRQLRKPTLPIKLLLFVPKMVSQWLNWGDIIEVWAQKPA